MRVKPIVGAAQVFGGGGRPDAGGEFQLAAVQTGVDVGQEHLDFPHGRGGIGLRGLSAANPAAPGPCTP